MVKGTEILPLALGPSKEDLEITNMFWGSGGELYSIWIDSEDLGSENRPSEERVLCHENAKVRISQVRSKSSVMDKWHVCWTCVAFLRKQLWFRNLPLKTDDHGGKGIGYSQQTRS